MKGRTIILAAIAAPLLIAVGLATGLGIGWQASQAGPSSSTATGARFAAVAVEEYEDYAEAGTVGGGKYREWMVGSADGAPWCATFVTWCADQLGAVEDGTFPKSGAVAEYVAWFEGSPEKGSLRDPADYDPQPGDIAVWQKSEWPNSAYDSHVGIVVEVAEDGSFTTVEGNCNDRLMKLSYGDDSGVGAFVHPAFKASFTSHVDDPASGEIKIDYGGYGHCYTYMGWQLITDETSAQYALRERAGMNFDQEGFGIIDGRYVVAVTDAIGVIGDYVDFYLADGTVLQCVVGDRKNAGDANATTYGHVHGGDLSVVEFVVDEDSWYPTGHANPGTDECHPEWDQPVVSASIVGSYDGGAGSSGGTSQAFHGCTSVVFSGLQAAGHGEGSGQDYANATAAQKEMADAACSGSMFGCVGGMCEAWVEQCLASTGRPYPGMCCATGGFEAWGVSSSKDGIPVGACVYGWSNPFAGGGCHGDFGHVGVYVGDGMVVSNDGGDRPTERTLEEWSSTFAWKGWGWCGGIDLSKEA